VDDFVVVSNSEQSESYVISILEQSECMHLGNASWTLGLEVRNRRKRTATTSERRISKTLLERFGIVYNVKALRNPLDPGQPIELHPHARSIAKLGRQLERADNTLEEREAIATKNSQ
jgi:hypothetical protein